MKFSLIENATYRMEETEKPKIGQGENLIKVKACGVCGSDIPRVFYGKAYHYPLVVGHEFSGVIEDSYDKSKIGKKVCVFPIKPCFNCGNCSEQNYANCKSYDYYGSRCDGGMQDYVVCKDFNIIELPPEMSYCAAAMTEPCAVCLHAVKKANLNEHSVLRVYGAGTIGLLCCMWARAKGVQQVSVFDIDGEKLAFAEKLGFKANDYQNPDVVIDASGAMSAVSGAIKEIKPFGTLVLLGNASGDMCFTQETYGLILRKQITVKGSWNSDFKDTENDWKDAVKAISAGVINPELLITHVFQLKDACKAFDMIKSKREIFNKVMVEMQ